MPLKAASFKWGSWTNVSQKAVHQNAAVSKENVLENISWKAGVSEDHYSEGNASEYGGLEKV